MSLAICCMYENHFDWKSRYNNYQAFRRWLDPLIKIGGGSIKLYVAEVKLDGSTYYASPLPYWDSRDEEPHTKYLHLKTKSVIGHYINAMNLLLQLVQEDYVAFLDTDIIFTNPYWVTDTIKALQIYDVVQMFSHIEYLGPNYAPIGLTKEGYYYQYRERGKITGGITFRKDTRIPDSKIAPPGGATAWRRSALNKVGGLIDWCIMGSSDFHMAAALLGGLEEALKTEEFTDDYDNMCSRWQYRAAKLNQNVGYVPGLVYHMWHGHPLTRKFIRHKTPLYDCSYTPSFDLVRNTQGVYELSDRSTDLKNAIYEFFKSRNEDSQDVTNGQRIQK
jgi:hypothetical protein